MCIGPFAPSVPDIQIPPVPEPPPPPPPMPEVEPASATRRQTVAQRRLSKRVFRNTGLGTIKTSGSTTGGGIGLPTIGG